MVDLMDERKLFELEEGWTRLSWPDMALEGREAFTAKMYVLPDTAELGRDIRTRHARIATDLEVLAALTSGEGRLFRSFIAFSCVGPTETKRVLLGPDFESGLRHVRWVLSERERYPADNIREHYPEITGLTRNDIWVKPTGWWMYEKPVAYLWAGVTTWTAR